MELKRILVQIHHGYWRVEMQEYLDSILRGICEKLQLTKSLYDKANERYQTIAKILDKNDALHGIELNIYPQGSFKLETTVKPIYQNEYDLDFVAELPKSAQLQPEELYNKIYWILKGDGIHDEMVERKNRCIRVNYANDFHLDIMPAKLYNSNTKEIIVPDRELKNWYHHSNPIRYAEWFESRARTVVFSSLMESRRLTASITPVTQQEITEKLEPLRKAVQLIKRYRDIYCDRYKKEPVRSIVICTLMGGISSTYSDTLQIIRDFCVYVNLLASQNEGNPFEIKNPVVDEILTEKWHENANNFYDFLEMVEALAQDIYKLQTYSTNRDMDALLKKMFGEKVTNDAIIENAQRIETARQSDRLFIDASGTIKTDNGEIPIKKNTFYGEKV